MRIAYLLIAVALVLTISCSSGVKTEPSISFDETTLSDNSSTITVNMDASQWSAVAGSWSLMCMVARLTVDRGFKYFYIDERRKPADGRPSFRATFYKSPPEGMQVVNVLDAGDPREIADPRTMVIEAEAYDELCNQMQRRNYRFP